MTTHPFRVGASRRGGQEAAFHCRHCWCVAAVVGVTAAVISFFAAVFGVTAVIVGVIAAVVGVAAVVVRVTAAVVGVAAVVVGFTAAAIGAAAAVPLPLLGVRLPSLVLQLLL